MLKDGKVLCRTGEICFVELEGASDSVNKEYEVKISFDFLMHLCESSAVAGALFQCLFLFSIAQA